MHDGAVEGIIYKNLRVNGYELESIKNVFIKTKINEHATLELTGILKNSEADKVISEDTENKVIEVYSKEDKNLTLFYGMVTNVKVNIENDVYTIKVQAKSMSYLMDIKIKSRSFQDKSMTMHSLINQIMEEYKGASYVLNIPNEPIKELLVQYEETDWELLKRVASKYNQGIFPNKNSKAIQYSIGPIEALKELKTKKLGYEVFKDLEQYQYMSKNALKVCMEADYISYKLQNHEIFELGDSIQLDNKQLYIYESSYEMKDGILENTYMLRVKNGIRNEREFNTKIIGSSIDGEIIAVKNDVVKVHLEIDKSQDVGKAYWFKYSTMSASTDGSGWYCMPEVGDKVKVYFPTKDETESFAVSSVSSYDASSKGEPDRMGNPDDKYLRTANDKEVKLTPSGILISCDGGQAEVKLNTDGTLSITSQNNINVNAKQNIKIEAQKSFLISSKKSVNIACDKGGGLNFDEQGQIREVGTKVNNNKE